MSERNKRTHKPIFITWQALELAMTPLHMGIKADIDRLHDLWKFGAPSPNTIVRVPNGYDPRKTQAGNFEARIVWFGALEKWVIDVSHRRGIPLTPARAHGIIERTAKYLGIDPNIITP